MPSPQVMVPTPPKSDPLERFNPASQGRAEFGEIDVSENAIDGMGAINFTDEEDCGFFGKTFREHHNFGIEHHLR